MIEELAFADEGVGVVTPLHQIVSNAHSLYSAKQIDAAIDRLAVALTVSLQDAAPLLLCDSPGGSYLTGMLMRRMVFPMQLGQLWLAENSEPEVRVEANANISRRQILLISSDNFDTDRFAKISAYLVEAGAASVRHAVLASLDNGTQTGPNTFTCVHTRTIQLVGCGFGYKGYGRNLPSLYQWSEGTSSANRRG